MDVGQCCVYDWWQYTTAHDQNDLQLSQLLLPGAAILDFEIGVDGGSDQFS